jgi:hypothetical protein
LSLHPDKNKYRLVTHNNAATEPYKIFIDNNHPNENDNCTIFELKRVTSNVKEPATIYLGVYFDKNVNFKFHVNYNSNKLSSALYS